MEPLRFYREINSQTHGWEGLTTNQESIMKFTEKDKSILIGLIIGDGWVGMDNNSAVIRINHSEKQKEYCIFKAKLLHSVFGGNTIKVHEGLCKYHSYVNGEKITKVTPRVHIQKKSTSCKWLRDLLYPNGKKKITREVLDYLTPQEIAIWWLDDGHVDFHKSGNGYPCVSLQWSTFCSEEEAKTIRDYFKEVWNIEWNYKVYDKRSPGMFSMSCAKTEGEKFLSIFRDFVRDKVPSMAYKVVDLDHEIRARLKGTRWDSLNLQDDKLQEQEDKEPLG